MFVLKITSSQIHWFFLPRYFHKLQFSSILYHQYNIFHNLTVKPHFNKTEKVFTVIEGETLNISLKTSGNPPQIKYKWKLPSTSSTHRVRTEGPKLILKNAQRMDRGNYSILAWNGHGNFNTTLHVFVDVRFPPRYAFLKWIIQLLWVQVKFGYRYT